METETRNIKLPNGGIMNVEIRPEFLGIVRQRFNIAEAVPVSDDDIQMFFFRAVKTAIEKVEQET